MKRSRSHTVIIEKIKESVSSVLPVTLIVAVMAFTFAEVSSGTFLSFFVGALLLVVGMGLFSLGADISMAKIGEHVGKAMTKSKSLLHVILLSFFVGVMITVSEPDLTVLAEQVSGAVENYILILAVGLGVGVFLVLAMLRIVFGIRLAYLLFFSYAVIFVLFLFVPDNFIPISFDSGGVTTGPMTVPFIMALGVGAASMRSDKNAQADAFGLVALCSAGPVIAVMVLGIIFKPDDAAWALEVFPADTTVEISRSYLSAIPSEMGEVAVALLPIIVFFLIYQFFTSRLARNQIIRIIIGALYTYVGLVLFLTGASCGFMQMGYEMGRTISTGPLPFIIVPLGAIVGYFTVKAEPAVAVLEKQVEEVTSGTISRKALGGALSAGVAISVAVSMLRALTGIPLSFVLIPCYAVALLLIFFTPSVFSSIAFDSGGVASGPMTSAFLLPLAAGVCDGAAGSIMTDAFGVVAMVAVTPLVAIQILGMVYKIKVSRLEKKKAASRSDDIIEL